MVADREVEESPSPDPSGSIVELSVLELEVESTTEDFESVSAGSSTVHPFRANAARRMVMYIKENLFMGMFCLISRQNLN